MTERTMGTENPTRLEDDENARRSRWDPHVIEAEAKRRPVPPLERGDIVVWTKRHGGCVSGLSEAHRAFPECGITYCSMRLPNDAQRVDVTLITESVRTCMYCEDLYSAGATRSEIEADNRNRAKDALEVA